MKKKIKRIFPFLICFCLFFLLVDDVIASSKKFKEDMNAQICYDTKTFNLIKHGSGAWDNCAEQNDDGAGLRYAETSVIKTSDGKTEVYCSDKDKIIKASSDGNFVQKLDGNFSSENTCIYYKGDTQYKNGDCSKIVGFVIAEGRNYNNKAADIEKWFNAQSAVWVYLGKFAPSPYKDGNDGKDNNGQIIKEFSNRNPGSNPIQIWDKSDKIKKIIKKAWERYAESLNYPEHSSKVNVSINATDDKFYYIPNGSTCGGGAYVTQPIKITNKSNEAVTLSIGVPSELFSVCDVKNSKCEEKGKSFKITLAKNETRYIKFATSYTFSGKVEFKVSTIYQTSFTYYDSQRYFNDGEHQGIIVPVKGETIEPLEVDLTFSQITVERRKCKSASSYGNINSNIFPQNSDGEPVKKTCASNVVEKAKDVKEKENDYQVNFSGCNCMAIDLGKGRKVNVLLYENVGFRFGTLSLDKVYPGGGFQFSTNNGISTTYQSKITWRYADYANGVPYYYNPNNLSLHDARAFEDEISNKIKAKLNDEIILNISTLDSNDAKDSEQKNIDIPLNFTSVDYDENNRVFTIKVNNIKMNEAYFSVDGTVNYEKTDKFFIDGGNKYYVPLHYVNSTEFPFNINLTNLSALPNMNFYYQAECGIKIDIDGYLYGNDGVRYRSIDLSNPFPKANEKSDVPYNWQEWYWNNATNKMRLKNAFQHYPNEPLYGININSNKLNKIGNLTYFYTSWSNINSDGSSEFVLDDKIDFYKYANDSSYCEIGKFSADCDK